MRVFNPYDEPSDRFGLNESGIDPFMILISAIPFIGISAPVGSLLYASTNPENRYNLANVAFNSAVVGTGIQLFWAAVLAAFLVVL